MRPTRAWRVPTFFNRLFHSVPFRLFWQNDRSHGTTCAQPVSWPCSYFFYCLVCFNPFFPLKERSFPSNDDQYYTIETCFDGLGKKGEPLFKMVAETNPDKNTLKESFLNLKIITFSSAFRHIGIFPICNFQVASLKL